MTKNKGLAQSARKHADHQLDTGSILTTVNSFEEPQEMYLFIQISAIIANFYFSLKSVTL